MTVHKAHWSCVPYEASFFLVLFKREKGTEVQYQLTRMQPLKVYTEL